jgi:histidinol-phosphate aminotransferase
MASPYNVNAAALAILPEALQDQEYVGRYVAQVLSNRERLQEELGNLGLHYWPSHANFVLVRIGPAHAEFVQDLRDRGILVRDRHTDPGCEGCVRLTVGSDEHTATLIGALREVVEQLRLRTRLRTELPTGVRA